MSSCPTCGNRDYLCQQCKMDELEDRLGLPEDHFDPDTGIVCWVQDISDEWHASMYFEGSRHVAACGELFETPVADVRDDPRRVSETSTCDACEAALKDDADEASADGGFEKASEIAADGGLEEVFRRETIVATDDGMAVGEDAVPEDDCEVRTDGGNVSSDIERAEDEAATLYEYHGPGASSDIVSRVKSHHSEATDTDYSRLTARKIARGGRRNRVTTVVVVGPSTTETKREGGGSR